MATLRQGSGISGQLGRLGSAFGEGVNQSVNEGLNYLAQKKLMELQGAQLQKRAEHGAELQASHAARQRAAQRAEIAESYAPEFGEEIARRLAGRSEKERAVLLSDPEYVKYLMSQGQQQNRPQEGMGALEHYRNEVEQPKEEIRPEDLSQLFNPLNPMRKENVRFGGEPSVAEQEQRVNQNRPLQALENANKGITAEELANAYSTPAQRQQRELLELKRQEAALRSKKDVREESKLENALNKETREYLAPYTEKHSKAEADIRDYKLLKELAKTGKVRSGTGYQLLSKLGLQDIGQNTITQLVGKINGRLATNVGGAFGGTSRITNYLESVFQRQLPGLWNSKEGIITISDINEALAEVDARELKARDEIIKENGGRIPGDIDIRAVEKMQPIRDRAENKIFDIIESIDKRGGKKSTGSSGYKQTIYPNKDNYQKMFNDLPDPSQYGPNDVVDQFSTGKSFVSNGKEWVPYKG